LGQLGRTTNVLARLAKAQNIQLDEEPGFQNLGKPQAVRVRRKKSALVARLFE
jgi:hypothetical protein